MPKLAVKHWMKQLTPSNDFTNHPGAPGAF